MKSTKRERKASIVASRMTGSDDDEFRIQLQFEDKEAPHFIEVRMTGQQFAEMLTSRVTPVTATETTRHG